MTGYRDVGGHRRPPPGPAGGGPMSRRRRAAVRAPAALLVLLLAAGPAAADYRRNYLDGRRALERGDVESALALLAEAARERPEEQARARLVGAIPEPYLPHHYLGLAHFRARNCPEALAEWEVSARQGAIAQVAEAQAEANRHRTECEGLAQAEQALTEAGAADAALAEALARGAAGQRLGAELSERRRAASDSLASARARLATVRREWDFAQVAAVAEVARQAQGEFAALRAEIEGETSGPGGSAEAASGDEAAGERPVDGARSDGHEARAAEGQGTSGEGSPATAMVALGPSPDLLAAVQAYLDGDYRGALARLDSLPAPTVRDRFLVALFRAASSHALYLLGGERDAALLRIAESAVAACRRENPRWLPSPDDFSPRFVRFYRGVATPD